MIRSTKFRLVALAVLGVALIALPGLAQAHKKSFKSTLTATQQNKNRVQGKLSSRAARCVSGRAVRLSAGGVQVASSLTDLQGDFEIQSKALAPGAYVVSVSRKTYRKTKRHRHRCRSSAITVVVS